MILVSGYSDDMVEAAFFGPDGKCQWEDEWGSWENDTLLTFDDGTVLRMSYRNGTWRAVVEKEGTAKHTVRMLDYNGDYYSDEFEIVADRITDIRKERQN